MKKSILFIFSCIFLILFSCGSTTFFEDEATINSIESNLLHKNGNYKILSLGDSYTIGESVCDSCKFPRQLADTLLKISNNKSTFPLKVIATTGWTTSNLLNAINSQNLDSDFSLATLLIGVNNQFQRKPFALYEREFPELIELAKKAVNNKKEKIIVLSIPDYAFTPFGRGNKTISKELDNYNDFAKKYCEKNGITFVDITEITRQGLADTSLVAIDGLHPSKVAYKKFIDKILPSVLEKLNEN